MQRFALVVIALLGCRKTADNVAPTAFVAPSFDAGAAEVVDAAGVAPNGPYAELLAPSMHPGDNVGPGRVVGFSSDDRYLGFAISTCDACTTVYRFRGPGVPPLDFGDLGEPGREDDPAYQARVKESTAKVEATLATLGASTVESYGVLRGPFPYPDLVFAEQPERSAQGRVSLHVGAHVVGESPVFPIHIRLGAHPMLGNAAVANETLLFEPSLGYLNVTKDGREIGAVAIATGSYWFENAEIARMPTLAFVTQIYNDTGMKRLAAKNNRGAAELFAKALTLAPDSALFAYNLACAAARENDPRAEPALAAAIGKSPAYRARARKDPDFARVRGEAWFTKLTR